MTTDTMMHGALAGMAGGAAMMAMKMGVAPHMPDAVRTHEMAPKQAVRWAEREAGHPGALSDSQVMAAGMAGHMGYSAATGAAYGALRETVMDGMSAPVAGALFGLGVWAASFEGWMPALGVKEATTEKPPEKWPMPLMGHMIFGVTTAAVYDALSDRREKEEW